MAYMVAYLSTILDVVVASTYRVRSCSLSLLRKTKTLTRWAWSDHPTFSIVLGFLIPPFWYDQYLRFKDEIDEAMKLSWLDWFYVSFSPKQA